MPRLARRALLAAVALLVPGRLLAAPKAAMPRSALEKQLDVLGLSKEFLQTFLRNLLDQAEQHPEMRGEFKRMFIEAAGKERAHWLIMTTLDDSVPRLRNRPAIRRMISNHVWEALQ